MNLPKYRKSTIPEKAKKVFEGVIFDVYQWEQELFDGSTTMFEKVARPDTVEVFPILDDGRILLLEDSQPGRDTVLTTPGGRVDAGETPEEATARELLEEGGLEAEVLVPFYDFSPEEKIDWKLYFFIGRGCKKVSDTTPDAGERIIPRPVSFEKLIELAANGTLRDSWFRILAIEAQHDPAKMQELRKKFLG